MKADCIIGVDPGKAGGIAIGLPDGTIRVAKMPVDMADLRDLLEYYTENYNAIVFLEKLSLRPDDIRMEDGKPNLGKMYRMQKLIENYAQLKATIEVANVPYVLVHPLSWQSKLGLRIAGLKEEKTERKKRYAEYARQLYPYVKVTLWNADALLIMQFGRWVLENDTKWVRANLPQREHHKIF